MNETDAQHRRKTAKYARFALTAIRQQGLAFGLAEFAAELAFDWRHRCRTLLPRELAGLGVPAAALADGVQYQGASPRLAAALFAKLPEESRESVFVDYGCGKGRGLLLAADHGFRRLIGVEFAPALAAECRENLKRSVRLPPEIRSTVVELDAKEFVPPQAPLVAFFYNPFHGRTLTSVAERLGRHAAAYAEVRVVYLNPVGLAEFIRWGFRETDRVMRRGRLLGVNLRASPP